MVRALLLLLLLVLPPHAGFAAALWETLPPTPPPVPGEHIGHARINGISLYYAVIGHGSPVVLLHGGLANSDYWGNQVKALAPHHTVILMDSRGHGRSTRDARPYGYDLMADDVVGLLDCAAHRQGRRGRLERWSDPRAGPRDAPSGPDRQGVRVRRQHRDVGRAGRRGEEPDLRPLHRTRRPRVCAAVGNAEASTTRSSRRSARCGRPSRTGPTRNCGRSRRRCGSWTATTTRRSSARTPSISPRRFQAPGLLILPNVSHFAFLQDPVLFNAALLHFLGDR